MVKKIERVLDIVLYTLCTVILGTLTALVAYTVVLRYIFNSGFPAGEELCRYLFVYVAFLGVILGVRADSHMRLTFLSDKFPKLKGFLDVVYYVCHYAFFGVVGYYGMVFAAQAATSHSTLLPITMNYIYGIVPFSAFFSLLYITLRLIRELQGLGSKIRPE